LEDTGLASPNNSAYRTIYATSTQARSVWAAGTYWLAPSTGNPSLSGSSVEGGNTLPFFQFAKADYEVANKTQKLRLRAQIGANATKPTIKFTFGLYPVTVAGAAKNLAVTLGAAVSGSTLEFNEPAASTFTSKETSDFTIPADGVYAFGIVTSAEITVNAAVFLSTQLQTRSV
jgi:hypothetical protein